MADPFLDDRWHSAHMGYHTLFSETFPFDVQPKLSAPLPTYYGPSITALTIMIDCRECADPEPAGVRAADAGSDGAADH